MSGMCRKTGKLLTGWAHVKQSIEVILTTRKETRVFLRQFGSDLHDFVDAPQNETTLLAFKNSLAGSIMEWEPRFELAMVSIKPSESGTVNVVLSGYYRPRALFGDFTRESDALQQVEFQTQGG